MDVLVDVRRLREILGYPPHDCHVQGLFDPPIPQPLSGVDMNDDQHSDEENNLDFDSQMTRLSPSQVPHSITSQIRHVRPLRQVVHDSQSFPLTDEV